MLFQRRWLFLLNYLFETGGVVDLFLSCVDGFQVAFASIDSLLWFEGLGVIESLGAREAFQLRQGAFRRSGLLAVLVIILGWASHFGLKHVEHTQRLFSHLSVRCLGLGFWKSNILWALVHQTSANYFRNPLHQLGSGWTEVRVSHQLLKLFISHKIGPCRCLPDHEVDFIPWLLILHNMLHQFRLRSPIYLNDLSFRARTLPRDRRRHDRVLYFLRDNILFKVWRLVIRRWHFWCLLHRCAIPFFVRWICLTLLRCFSRYFVPGLLDWATLDSKNDFPWCSRFRNVTRGLFPRRQFLRV